MEKGETDINEVSALLEQTKVKQQNKVSFKGCGLKLDKKEDACDIINALENCKDLQVFELVGNTVGFEAAEWIADTLKSKPELERCLWADMFTGRLRSELPKSLRSLGCGLMEAKTHLVELDLSDNAFGPDGAKACEELLMSTSAYTLEILRFNNNGLGAGGIIIADALIECHKQSLVRGRPIALKVFVAGRNRLENPGAKALARAFRTIGTLEEIQLPQNGIQHEGIAALAEAVKLSPHLRHLNLNDNTFVEKGAIAMAEGLKNINSLEVINFGDCLVRTEGAKAIASALKSSNPNLKHLFLQFGEIHLEGGQKICEAVSTKKALEILDMNGNQFGDDGVEEIKDLAKEFHSIDALASLSDDEGVCSDDESESGEDEYSGGLVEVVNGTSYNKSEQLNESLLEETIQLTGSNFLSMVTSTNIVKISADERAQILEEVAELVSDAEATAGALVTLSDLLDEECLESLHDCKNASAERLRNAVFQCADVIVADAFDKYPNTPMLVINPILVKMGLIKSEKKKDKPVEDLRSLAIVLGHISQQPYFPSFTRTLVRSLVIKENKIWEISPVLRSQLLQVLYS